MAGWHTATPPLLTEGSAPQGMTPEIIRLSNVAHEQRFLTL